MVIARSKAHAHLDLPDIWFFYFSSSESVFQARSDVVREIPNILANFIKVFLRQMDHFESVWSTVSSRNHQEKW